jgi:type IV pilus assembly protein PilE
MDSTHGQRSIRRAAQPGFTLIELMLVVVLLGILAAVALPTYHSQVLKGRRADAITALSNIQQLQERMRSNRSSYVSTLGDLGLAEASEHYQLSLSGVGNPPSFAAGFTATATPRSGGLQASDDKCASLFITVAGAMVTNGAKDKNGNDSAQACWPK